MGFLLRRVPDACLYPACSLLRRRAREHGGGIDEDGLVASARRRCGDALKDKPMRHRAREGAVPVQGDVVLGVEVVSVSAFTLSSCTAPNDQGCSGPSRRASPASACGGDGASPRKTTTLCASAHPRRASMSTSAKAVRWENSTRRPNGCSGVNVDAGVHVDVEGISAVIGGSGWGVSAVAMETPCATAGRRCRRRRRRRRLRRRACASAPCPSARRPRSRARE